MSAPGSRLEGRTDVDGELQREVSRFLEAYKAAFDRLDGRAIAALFSEPSGLLSGSTYVHWPTRKDVERNMRALCEIYRRDGYREASHESFEVLQLGAHSALVDVRWRIDRAEGTPRRFGTAYHLVRKDARWWVLLCIAYEEERAS